MAALRVFSKVLGYVFTLTICIHSIANTDATVKSAFTADQHFAEAKKLIDEQSGEGTPRRLVDGAIFHLDQALASGYNKKKTRGGYCKDSLDS